MARTGQSAIRNGKSESGATLRINRPRRLWSSADTWPAKVSRRRRPGHAETRQRLGAPLLGSGKLQTPPNRYPPARLLTPSTEQPALDLRKPGMTPEDRRLEIVLEALFLRAPTQSTEPKQFMVRRRFCQRSQFRRMQPAVGIRRRHVDLFRRNNQQRALLDVRQRIDFVALAYAQRAPAKQKERHIGAKLRGDLQQPHRLDSLACELQVPQKRRRGVA